MVIKSSESMEAEHPIVIKVDGKNTLYISPGHLTFPKIWLFVEVVKFNSLIP